MTAFSGPWQAAGRSRLSASRGWPTPRGTIPAGTGAGPAGGHRDGAMITREQTWILGGIVALAGALIACGIGYDSTYMWSFESNDEWPAVVRYLVFFGLNAIVAALGASAGVVLGLVLARAGIAIILACAFAGPSACAFAFVGGFSAGLNGRSTVLTLPSWAIMGACCGASAGAFIGLLRACRVGHGFCFLFGAALGAVAWMILSEAFFSTRPASDLIEASALGITLLGGLGGAATCAVRGRM
jgi:hypothetical protein